MGSHHDGRTRGYLYRQRSSAPAFIDHVANGFPVSPAQTLLQSFAAKDVPSIFVGFSVFLSTGQMFTQSGFNDRLERHAATGGFGFGLPEHGVWDFDGGFHAYKYIVQPINMARSDFERRASPAAKQAIF